MQKPEAPSNQAESPKLVLLGKLVQLLTINLSGGFAEEKIDKMLILLDEILEFGTPENGLNPSKLLSELSYELAFCVLLSIDFDAAESYRAPKPYADEFQRVRRNGDRQPIFATKVNELANFASVTQIEAILALLLKHQMYDEIIQLVKASVRASDKIQAAIRKFLRANLNVPGLLALLSTISDLDDGQYEAIFESLLTYCQQEQQGQLVCRQFLAGLAGKSRLRDKAYREALGLFRNLCAGRQELATIYLAYGFRPLTVQLFHSLSLEEQHGLLADQRLKLTSEEVGDIVAQKKELTREYLDWMSCAIHYATPVEQANPRRSEKLVNALAVCCNASSWGSDAQSQFTSFLGNPLTGLDTFHVIKSVPALFALFEQFSLLKATKEMYFLQRPGLSIKIYFMARQLHVGKMSKVDTDNSVLFSLTEMSDSQSKLNKAEIPFIQSCGTLASSMNATQAEWLLRFLIKDKALHVRIPDLIGHPDNNEEALRGYLKPYLEIMLDPNADPELKKILSPYGGELMVIMSAEELKALLKSIYVNGSVDELRALLMKLREGKKLPLEIIKELIIYFVELSQSHSELHEALFPAAFAHLCDQLVPAMNEGQRRAVLSDPLVEISVPLIQALPMIQTPVPANGHAPLGLSPECVRILVLRSAGECRPALDHLITIFVATHNFDVIVSMFTEYLSDQANGAALSTILLKDYFLKFIGFFISRVNIFDSDDVRTKTVLDLLEILLDTPNNDAQLKQVIEVLVKGCNERPHNLKYNFIVQKLFEKPKLQARLFKNEGAAELFKGVVDSFAGLERKVLSPLVDFIFSNNDLKEPLVRLLTVFTGLRVVPLNSNDMNQNVYTTCFRGEDICDLLYRASKIPAYIEEVRRAGSRFISRCCEEAETVKRAVPVLKLYLQYGCRPSEEHMRRDAAKIDWHNPFHQAAAQRNIPLLELMLPYLRRVGPVMLGLMISIRTLDVEFSKEAFDVVFNVARDKDPDCFKDPAFRSLYELFRFSLTNRVDNRPKLEACLSMIEAGIELYSKNVEAVMIFVMQQDETFIEKFKRALEVHSPHSYLMYLIRVLKSDSAEEKAKTAEIIHRVFHEQVDKLGQGTLSDLLAWARSTQQPAEFIAEIESKFVHAAPRQPAPVQFFGGSAAASPAKAPLKRAVLVANSHVSAAAQPLKSAIQDPESSVSAATETQFFGGGKDTSGVQTPVKSIEQAASAPLSAVAESPFFGGGDAARPAAPLKKTVLSAKSPVKAATQPQFFGGSADTSPAKAPLKRPVLGPRAPVAVTAGTPVKSNGDVSGGDRFPVAASQAAQNDDNGSQSKSVIHH